MRIIVNGVETMTRRINIMVQELEGHPLEEVMLRGVRPMAELARRKAPVDTGELRRSIKAVVISAGGGQAQTAVVAEAEHAPYVEFGTYKMAAQPFLRPAFSERHHQSQTIVAGGMQAIIFKAIAK